MRSLLLTFCGLLGVFLARAAEPALLPPERGRILGCFTEAGTNKPIAGVKLRFLIDGVPGKAAPAEAISDADGRYALDVPIGHCVFWGVFAPAGYYTQDAKAYRAIATTSTAPRIVQDFVLQPGSPWRVELHGASAPPDKPPFFSAFPDPDRQQLASGDIIMATGDRAGKAVLTIPTAGGRYRFSCGLAQYETPTINLDFDKDFEPRRIKGAPEPLAQGKGVRLRDAEGRAAVVEGGEVVIENGQAVLRFPARRPPTASSILLCGVAVDEAGKPVEGAKCTAAFFSDRGGGRGGYMSHFEATTDAQGKFGLPNVSASEAQVAMTVNRSGFHGAQTQTLDVAEAKKTGIADFGTVVLTPGRTLRGKVVDEEGRVVHGAVVTNSTNYFLYSHLRCRTDAQGRFAMPDLAFGNQRVGARFGDRFGSEQFPFDVKNGECVITVRLHPQSGRRPGPAPKADAARPMPVRAIQADGDWDLTPPTKEPKYQKEPKYALLAFGAKRETRVWMVLDGATLYVDRNANGDLTEPDERLEPSNPKDGSNRYGNPGLYTHFNTFEFKAQSDAIGSSKFQLHQSIAAESFVPKTDFEKKWHAKRLELRFERCIVYRQEGLGRGQTPVWFMPKPSDAPICHFGGPLTFTLKLPEHAILQRGEAGCDVAFHIGTPGRVARNLDEVRPFVPLLCTEVPGGAHLAVDIEFPGKTAQAPPIRKRFYLKQRC